VDIVEGINDQTPNLSSLHTTDGKLFDRFFYVLGSGHTSSFPQDVECQHHVRKPGERLSSRSPIRRH
jgi:hypothetical protein